MKPLGYYISVNSSHPDNALLQTIEEEFGTQLESLSVQDKAALVCCLLDSANNLQQIVIEIKFNKLGNAYKFWQIASQLTANNKMMLALALMNQIYGGIS